jgi:transposase
MLSATSCGNRVLKKIQDRWHSCHVCGFEPDRDVGAALINRNYSQGLRWSACLRVASSSR